MIPQDKIIEWAREADIYSQNPHVLNRQLEYFAKLVAQHQKEQNARICDEIEKHLGIASECAAAIRNQNES